MHFFSALVTRLRFAFLVVAIAQIIIGVYGLAMAQEAAPAPQSASWLDAVLAAGKAVLPQVLAFLSGYLTKLVTWGLSLTPAPYLSVVSSFIGALGAAMTSAVEGMSVDAIQANATIGAGSGALGHAVLQSKPIQPAT